MSGSNYEAGQNITVKGVINGKSVDMTLVTDGEGKIVINDVHDYLIVVIHDDDSYYTGSQKLFTNMNLNVNVTYQICYDKTVNLTAKSNILTDLVRGRFVLSNGTEINATYASNGTWWAVYTFDDYGEYNVSASFYDYNEYNPTGSYIHDVYVTNPFIKLNDVHVNSGLISIYKGASTISTVNVTVEYADSINFTVETEGATGITAEMDGGDVVVVDNFTVVLNGLSIGNYTLTVTTIPDGDHNSVKGSIIVHVIRAPAKIIVENDTMEMNVLDIRSINPTLSPAGEGTFTYVSNNSDVVVAAGGKLIALREGNAKITVSFAGNENYYAAENKTIIVKVTLKNTSVSVVKSTLDLKVGDEFELGAISIPGILNVQYVSSNESVARVSPYGMVTAVSGGTAVITLTVGNGVTYAVNSTTVTVKVNEIPKIPTEITSSAITTVYNVNKYLIVNLKDKNGNPLGGVKVTVILKGAKTYVTDKKGQIKVSTKGLVPKKYAAKITFNGNAKYLKSTKNIRITVKKATPKMTAKKKTFKKSIKVKKYSVTLKNNKGKVMKKVKVTLKIRGKKVIIAKTNSKGKATFKIKGLKKKGTYKATVTYKGNKYYNKVVKKVNIKVR